MTIAVDTAASRHHKEPMSTSLFESLFQEQALMAVAVEGVASKSRDADLPANVLDCTIEMCKKANTPVRAVAGTYTISTYMVDEGWVAVAYKTGHAIAKSIARMVRRRAKNPNPRRTNGQPVSGVQAW